MQSIIIDKKSTVIAKFEGNPESITVFFLYKNNIVPYFFRNLGGRYTEIKINLCHAGKYFFSENGNYILTELKTEKCNFILPPPERKRNKNIHFVSNFDIGHTPARIHSHTGKIEIGKRFTNFPFSSKLFILLHEVGHLYYKTEHYCDMFALKYFVENGYNYSAALLALTRILKDNAQNKLRIKKLFNHLKKSNK
jgi:hypothetical protein